MSANDHLSPGQFPTKLFHGGLPHSATLNDVDLNRLGTQQNKRGRSYGGFYLTDQSSKSWSEDYAKQRGAAVHEFTLKPEARVLDHGDRNIDRLSSDERSKMAETHDVVKGKDTLGRNQYALLNKDSVQMRPL